MTPTEYLKKYANLFVIACEGSHLFPSVKIAQAALETGWGGHIVGNNLYGIKATGSHTPYWNGQYVSAGTSEYQGGSYNQQNANFRAYSSMTDSIMDHNYLIESQSRYQPVRDAKTPEEQARALQDAGYATGPSYANKLISIINSYNLKQYDQKKNHEIR